MPSQLVVRLLPWTVGSRELRNYFSKFGEVQRALVVFDKNTGLSKGIGFVDFKNGEAFKSITNIKDHVIEGKKVEVFEKHV